MILTGTALLIISAFLHASWNAIIKKSENKNVSLFLIILIATLFSVLISPFTGGYNWGSPEAIIYMLIAGLFEGGYFYTLSKTLQLAPLGLGYAVMRGGAMVFVWVFSATFLQEKVSALSVFGILLILFGIVLANPHKSEKGFSKNGFLFAILAAFFIAGYHIFYGFSLQHGASQVALFVGSMLVSIPVLIIICGKSIFQINSHLAGHKKYMILLAGVLSAASFILFLFGLKSTEAGLAISLRNTSVAFAQLFALILGERLNRTQWFAFSCVLCGTVFLI